MKVKIIFEDWKKDDHSVYSTEEGTQLTLGSFHAGSTFDVDINLTQDDEEDIKRAIQEGYTPVFSLDLTSDTEKETADKETADKKYEELIQIALGTVRGQQEIEDALKGPELALEYFRDRLTPDEIKFQQERIDKFKKEKEEE